MWPCFSAFKAKLVDGMVHRGYERDFAEKTFKQLEGFGSYGFSGKPRSLFCADRLRRPLTEPAGFGVRHAVQKEAFPILGQGRLENTAKSTAARPRSADRTRSPDAISGKREFFKREPETIAKLAEQMPRIGAWRPEANSQKPANGGPFCEDQRPFL